MKKNLHVGVAGVQNVYTQHTPLMAKVIDSLMKGQINETQYPLLGSISNRGNRGGGGGDGGGGKGGSQVNQNVVVWMMGGTTYEESAHVYQLNQSEGSCILLGGSCVHNSTSFLREVSVAPVR